jgi:hypothetical protein
VWRKAWVNGIKGEFYSWRETCHLVQNEGTGIIIQGTRDWRDYRVSAEITFNMVESGGVAACVQGLQRYYALLLCKGGKVRLVKIFDGTMILSEKDFDWQFGETYELALEAGEPWIRGWIDGNLYFTVEDHQPLLLSGAVGIVCEKGHIIPRAVRVESV